MIVMGRIVAPFGIHGWLKVQPLGDDPMSWRRMPQWWIGPDPDSAKAEDWRPVVSSGLRPHGKLIVVALEGVADRTAAEAIDGWFLAAPREALPKPGKDEYYWADLIGLRVTGKAGVPLGVVRGLIETGAHDVLEIADGETERLIPFVGAYVLDVNLAAGLISVDWEADW
ncbi:ribosome maturation factor RimM [Uliginosibacterium aquaticum]|uniref:Ribosome maturation factor RimM n=1 Tax=Uliginosibacterium aquaticum TaxID=2731212 RepID=A0ABX2IQ44_9RHOO|nr:ribosome maturation factor RimM [Uliginosibacterium aquaticum]NSL56378.1 ribosome maturation factor RimM [Uliginosibacterium aquaticum]